MRLLRLAACILLLALTLGAPAAFASPAPTAGSGDLLLQLRSFLLSLWSDTSCRLDPLGSGSSASKTIAKAGCEIEARPGARAAPLGPGPDPGIHPEIRAQMAGGGDDDSGEGLFSNAAALSPREREVRTEIAQIASEGGRFASRLTRLMLELLAGRAPRNEE